MSKEIRVKRLSDGQVFSSNMADSNKFTITEINFCTSYTQVMVQWRDGDKFPEQEIICPPLGSEPNPVDFVAFSGDEEEGIIL